MTPAIHHENLPARQESSGYAVVLTTFGPHSVIRLPMLETVVAARDLGLSLKSSYPTALVEIAHEGLRITL